MNMTMTNWRTMGLMAVLTLLAGVAWQAHGAAGLGLMMAAAPIVLPEEASGKLREMMRGFLTSHVTALHGLLDKLPEAARGELKALHDNLNDQLAKLPPIEQVAGAQAAAWALECLTDAVGRVQAYAGGLLERITKLGTEYNGKVAELNGLNERVTKGELLDTVRVKELCEQAETKGKTEAEKLLRPEIAATRKSALELAGLPLPADAVLELNAAEYQPRLTQATANLKALAERGMKLGGKGAEWVKQTAWLPATEFNAQMKIVEDLVPSGGGRGTAPDPLLGNTGGGNGTEKRAIALC